MVNKECLKTEIDNLPDEVLEEVQKYIMLQKFFFGIYENDTDYLNSIPGMAEKIISGMNEPLSECVSEDEVVW